MISKKAINLFWVIFQPFDIKEVFENFCQRRQGLAAVLSFEIRLLNRRSPIELLFINIPRNIIK
jgi:hypothetical protein